MVKQQYRKMGSLRGEHQLVIRWSIEQCQQLWFAIYCIRSWPIDLEWIAAEQSACMPALLLSIFRFVRLLLSGHQALAIENAALRLQLAAFQRKRQRLVLTTFDRVFWITLRRVWSGWRPPLLYVQADTVARWQRERFRRFWERLSKRHGRRRGRLPPSRFAG
jgi:hypothetical protein